jgi:hypothetical protein
MRRARSTPLASTGHRRRTHPPSPSRSPPTSPPQRRNAQGGSPSPRGGSPGAAAGGRTPSQIPSPRLAGLLDSRQAGRVPLRDRPLAVRIQDRRQAASWTRRSLGSPEPAQGLGWTRGHLGRPAANEEPTFSNASRAAPGRSSAFSFSGERSTPQLTVRAVPGRLSALSVFLLKSILYGAFVWAHRALNGPKRRFPARAV